MGNNEPSSLNLYDQDSLHKIHHHHYKLLKELYKVDSIGPLMLGMDKPVHIFQLGASVEEMVNMAAIAVIDAQEKEKKVKMTNA